MPAERMLNDARELIEIESITGNEEGVVRRLECALDAMGLETRSEQVAAGRRNLMAGPERPAVLFCTHTDTVPPHIPLREDERYLYGRGACDTKGISAAMLEAGRRLLAEGIRDFGYLFVVGEEVDNAGARAANRHVRAGHVIVGEPTENRLAVGHKGFVSLRVEVEGTPCHSAYPERGDSALHRLLAALARLQASDFGNDDVLGPATLNIGVVQGGVAANVLAPHAEARIALRVVGDLDEAEQLVRACFADPATGREDPRVSLEIISRMPRPKLERLEGLPETTVSYGTDVPFLQDVGKAFLLGPGSILDAHTDHEKIEKAAMEEAAGIYAAMVKRLRA